MDLLHIIILVYNSDTQIVYYAKNHFSTLVPKEFIIRLKTASETSLLSQQTGAKIMKEMHNYSCKQFM